MRPADLAASERQVVIGPPAIRGHDRCAVAEQLAGVVLVTVGGDPIARRCLLGERAPQRPALRLCSRQPVSSMFSRPERRNAAEQIVVGQLERVAARVEDRVDAAGRRSGRRTAPRTARPRPGARRGCAPTASRPPPGTRAERAASDLRGQRRLSPRPRNQGSAPAGTDARSPRSRSAATPRPDGATGSPTATTLASAEHVPALARRRPVLDHLIHRPRRQQLTTVALMPGLPALLATRPALAGRDGGFGLS